MNKTKVSLSFYRPKDREVLEWAKDKAKENDMSLSAYIRAILRKLMRKGKTK